MSQDPTDPLETRASSGLIPPGAAPSLIRTPAPPPPPADAKAEDELGDPPQEDAPTKFTVEQHVRHALELHEEPDWLVRVALRHAGITETATVDEVATALETLKKREVGSAGVVG